MVSFRETPADEPAALALLTEYFESRELGFAHGKGGYKIVFPAPEAFVPPRGVFLIVEDLDLAGEPADVGCGGVRNVPFPEPAPFPEPVEGRRFELKHIYLQPHLRGRGFGRVLLTELEARATALGATELVLDTNESLEAAGGLYRSSGYEPIEPYNDNPNATHWYGKRIFPT
jgi:GNAT superfamily N-acetyltransferase